mmetsp:Transcript_23984/g.77009  ORF Transcript_23984/g.77009 Transcript_23984/m.77009 type:complete len:210 (-) Transcript_23984:696-1325(-)
MPRARSVQLPIQRRERERGGGASAGLGGGHELGGGAQERRVQPLHDLRVVAHGPSEQSLREDARQQQLRQRRLRLGSATAAARARVAGGAGLARAHGEHEPHVQHCRVLLRTQRGQRLQPRGGHVRAELEPRAERVHEQGQVGRRVGVGAGCVVRQLRRMRARHVLHADELAQQRQGRQRQRGWHGAEHEAKEHWQSARLSGGELAQHI